MPRSVRAPVGDHGDRSDPWGLGVGLPRLGDLHGRLGDSGLRGAFLLAVMASLTALPVGIALLMPGSQRRSGGGRSIARCVLLAGAAANALMGVGCIALAVHFVQQGPALVFWFGVLPALLFGAVAFGFVRWALSLR